MQRLSDSRNPYLDGLRGIAILLVICFHYFTGFTVVDFGWMGVDLFFVLSGFLLTGRLYPYLHDKKLLQKFYLNRFLRIVPLFYAFLTVFFLLWFCLGSAETISQFPGYRENMWGFYAFFANWMLIFHFPDSYIHLNHLWSLAAEEQFYIVFPWLVLLLRKKRPLLITGLLLMLLILISRIIFYFSHDPAAFLKIYWNSFFRADSFLTGFVLYMLIENGGAALLRKYALPLLLVCCGAIITGAALTGTMRVSPFFVTAGFSFIAIACAVLLFYCLESTQNFIKKITSFSFLKKLGKLSYGMYLFHIPLYLSGFSAVNFLYRKAGIHASDKTIQLTNALVCFGLTYILALLSFRFYESYFLRLKKKPVADLPEENSVVSSS